MEENEPAEHSPDSVFLTAVLFETVLGLLAILLGWIVGPDARAMIPKLNLSEIFPAYASTAIQWEAIQPIASGVLYGLLASVPILVLIEVFRRLPWKPVRDLERLSDEGMIKALLELRPAEMAVISICAGIGEELLFRGWLMYWLIDSWQELGGAEVSPALAITAGLIGSSIAFGLVHPISKLYVVLAAVMGVYFGALVLWTGNLLVPIVAHAAYDAIQLIIASRGTSEPHAAQP